MTAIRRLAYVALVLAYGQIVFGAIVRITDSGMGCGDHWPKCNGEWFPAITSSELLIEIAHRWIAAALLLVIVAMVGVAWTRRREPGVHGKGGVLRAASLAALLWFAPAILGAITVWLELPPLVVVVHLALAMILLALLVVVALRAGALGMHGVRTQPVGARTARSITAAAVIAFVVVVLGGLTANIPGAAPACQGFPLCNGAVLTDTSTQTIHWTHRVLAYLFALHVVGVFMAVRKREGLVMRRATTVLLAAVVVQILVAAALVSMHLPAALQSLHQAVGAFIWLSVVTTAMLARYGALATTAALPADGASSAVDVTQPLGAR